MSSANATDANNAPGTSGSGTQADDDMDPPSRPGRLLTLQRYAFVTAALSEGYTLLEALEREGISETDWEDTEEHWVDELDESMEGDMALHDELDRELASARALFARPIAPLDTDVAKFMAFQRHLLSAPAHLPFLRDHGLFFGDWIRLQEAWAERFSADEKLRAEAARADAESDADSTGATESGSKPQPLDFTVEPGPRVWPAPRRTEVAATPTVETTAEPAPEEALWGLAGLRGAVAQIQITKSPVEGAAPAPGAAPLPSFMRRAADDAAKPVARAPLAMEAFPPTDTIDVETTQDAQPSPIRAALPFGPPAPRTGPPADLGPKRMDLTLPDETIDDDHPPSTVQPRNPLKQPTLPFARPGPKGILARPTQSSEAAPPDAAKAAAIAARAASAAGAAKAVTAADPAATELTLGQYAALCAELAAFPGDSEAVFARHGLPDPQARTSVDVVWRERLRADAPLYARWQTLFEQHTARIKR